tara:strand:+ start:1392 stop:1592 length:201 start_codon:yes stop_codon:yes gene_type:complete
MKVYDTPDAINNYRIKTLRSALKLEILGMKRKGQSVYQIIKNEFGFTGSKQRVLEQLNTYIKTNNI